VLPPRRQPPHPSRPRWASRPDHQRRGGRVLTDGRTLLAHAVGAGKTATMVMAAMELRRLGSASKPRWWSRTTCSSSSPRVAPDLPTARILVADRAALEGPAQGVRRPRRHRRLGRIVFTRPGSRCPSAPT
jgi:N12 class adenine-specific DNA methylase